MKTPETNDKKVKWSYYLAWISFIIAVLGGLLAVLEKHKPPEKNDYEK